MTDKKDRMVLLLGDLKYWEDEEELASDKVRDIRLQIAEIIRPAANKPRLDFSPKS